MYDATITLFNYRKKDDTWRTLVFQGVDLIEHISERATTQGHSNQDAVEIILRTRSDRTAMAVDGDGNSVPVKFVTPKEYAELQSVEGFFTLAPEKDFIVVGDHRSSEVMKDDDYEEGLYTEMNYECNGVYMITNTTWYSLLPHFEIGGR